MILRRKSREEGRNTVNDLKYLHRQLLHFIKEETGSGTLGNLSKEIWSISSGANNPTQVCLISKPHCGM